MTIFKTLLKIVKANKSIIILYTVLLVVFGTINMKTGENNLNFASEKPSIYIVNKDNKESKVTNNFIKYLKDNTKLADIKNEEDAINDALFYRDANYIIYIPKNFGEDLAQNKDPKLDIKSNQSADASLAEMLVNNYISTFKIYVSSYKTNFNIDDVIEKTNNQLKSNTKIEIKSKLDTNELQNAAYFYNFMNYSLIAASVYVICIIISSFRDEKVRKRTVISSINYKKYNRKLLLSNGVIAFIIWLLYNILGICLIGKVMFTIHGLLYILNSFVFAICALTLAFLISNITTNKSAISGLINVLAVGSSFICGAFVPPEMLPESVLLAARVLPSYWFINSNQIIKTLEVISLSTIKPMLINTVVLLAFTLLFIIVANIISNKKRKIN